MGVSNFGVQDARLLPSRYVQVSSKLHHDPHFWNLRPSILRMVSLIAYSGAILGGIFKVPGGQPVFERPDAQLTEASHRQIRSVPGAGRPAEETMIDRRRLSGTNRSQ